MKAAGLGDTSDALSLTHPWEARVVTVNLQLSQDPPQSFSWDCNPVPYISQLQRARRPDALGTVLLGVTSWEISTREAGLLTFWRPALSWESCSSQVTLGWAHKQVPPHCPCSLALFAACGVGQDPVATTRGR